MWRVHCRYAYVLYDDVETAKSVVQEYTDDPPMFFDKPLDVKFYREPVAQIPKGNLSSVFFCTRNNISFGN